MNVLENYKILIVDDEADIREVIATKLSLYGAQCDQAEDGVVAFKKIQQTDYDCVVADIRMPNASGIDLAKMIQDYEGKSPKFILMSAFTDLNAESAKGLGVQGLYLKPDDLDYLIEMIKSDF